MYAESLDRVVVTVEGEKYTLRDFAVYVAFQEAEVEKQALVYDAQNPKKYWGLNLNGEFIRFSARDTAVDMLVHDMIFYQMAQEMKITLSEDELELLENDVEDFWCDLVDENKQEKLGITREDVYQSFVKIAYAQKAQMICASMHGEDYAAYDSGREVYKRFVTEYEVKINEEVVEKLYFGNITLEY